MALRRTFCGLDNLTIDGSDTPIWDIRDRRPSSSEQSTSSGFSSCSSPEGQVGGKLGDTLHFDHVRTMAEVSVASSQSAHAPKSVAHVRCDHPVSPPPATSRSKVKVYVRVQGESDETCLRQIYKPILDMIDPDTDVLDYIDDPTMEGGKWPLVLFGGCKDASGRGRADDALVAPSLALVLMIREREIVGSDHLRRAMDYLRRPPWRFHHGEWVSAPRISACPHNSLDYFTIADQLPACSIRQLHAGRQLLRLQRYVSHENWPDAVNLYQLIVGRQPDHQRSDFCVFAVDGRRRYGVQLALKRLPRGVAVSVPCHTIVRFLVADVRALLPLLPHACRRLSDVRWQTTDIDGNELFLEEEQTPAAATARRRHRPRSRSRPRSRGSRRSVGSTSSVASVIVNTAKEFLEAANEISSAASVFSEPCLRLRANEFRLDRSSSTSVARSVAPPDGRTGAQTASDGGLGRQVEPRERARSPGDISDIRATPDHRRFAWVRDMMESTPDIHRHLHQHTDSGFADDRSDESERTNHMNCRQQRQRQQQQQCSSSDSCNKGRIASDDSGDNSHGEVDSCDKEIERLRLYQSNPEIPRLSPSVYGSVPGSVLSHWTAVEIPDESFRSDSGAGGRNLDDGLLPNRMLFDPARYRTGHVTPEVHGVKNVRATSCGPRNLMSPAFGCRIPPRCTSTPLVHTPAFRALSCRRTDIQIRQDRALSRNQQHSTDSEQLNPSNQEQPDYGEQLSSEHQKRSTCGKQLYSTRHDEPSSHQLTSDKHLSSLANDDRCRRERTQIEHKSGLPPLAKPKLGSVRGAYPESKSLDRRRLKSENSRVPLAVQSRVGDVGQFNGDDRMRNASCRRTSPDAHDVIIGGGGDFETDPRDQRPDLEQSFEEAAIDCPPSLVQRTTSSDVTNASAKQSPLAETGQSTAQPSCGSMTSLPRSRPVSKMVTFAEEVQEKDISNCLDDASMMSYDSGEIHKTNSDNDGDPVTMGFWI